MQKVKNYAIALLAVFVLVLIWQLNNRSRQRDQERFDKDRWYSNYLQVSSQSEQNKKITLTQKEFIALKDARIGRLLDSLKIKPKIVVRYEERLIVQRETISVEVPVVKIGQGTYKISDSGPCFVWQGEASILTPDSLNVKRTAFFYENSEQTLLYRKQKGRFLFWKTYYKDKVDQFVNPQCGETSSKVIDILR